MFELFTQVFGRHGRQEMAKLLTNTTPDESESGRLMSWSELIYDNSHLFLRQLLPALLAAVLAVTGHAGAMDRAAIPASPGAEGAGAFTPGGRGGKVFEVTNLNDDGPGSLRAALEAQGPRIVVFRVSGIITLEKLLTISNPYVTVITAALLQGLCVTGPVLARTAPSAGNLTPVELRCEYTRNPLGVDAAHPHLSWMLKGQGEEVFRPRFTYFSFQYLYISGAERPGDAKSGGRRALLLEAGSEFLTSSAAAVGSFECSNPLLNDINAMIGRSVRSNLPIVVSTIVQSGYPNWRTIMAKALSTRVLIITVCP